MFRKVDGSVYVRIRELAAEGKKHRAIAKELGVCRTTVQSTLERQREDDPDQREQYPELRFRELASPRYCDECGQRVWMLHKDGRCVACYAREHKIDPSGSDTDEREFLGYD